MSKNMFLLQDSRGQDSRGARLHLQHRWHSRWEDDGFRRMEWEELVVHGGTAGGLFESAFVLKL